LGRPVEFYFKRARGAVKARVNELLRAIDLPESYAKRFPGELSGGQKQRICIARALAAEPDVIICDEVTSALDQLVGEGILKLLKHLQEELGIAYLFISHDLSTVQRVANKVAVMLNGRIVASGETSTVFSPPRDPYTELLLSSVPELRPDWLDGVLAKRAHPDDGNLTGPALAPTGLARGGAPSCFVPYLLQGLGAVAAYRDHRRIQMKVLVLGGDGIGPEVTASAEAVLRAISKREDLGIEFEHDLVGGTSYDVTGKFATDEMIARARKSQAILFGAEGGSKWDTLELDGTPEERSGLSRLRRELELFANLRPIKPFEALVSRSTLKADAVRNVDFIIVRELCGGIYFGQPRGIVRLPDGTMQGVDTQSYTEAEIERVARTAFALARSRRRRLASVDKANVMESGVLWRRIVTRLGKTEFSDVALEHLYADNAAMQIIREPRQFDVIVTDNLFGDILSDGAAMIAGSLGMLPSASLSADSAGRRFGLYEPVHGSAPDIAGRGVANPLGSILSVAMMLDHSFKRPDLTDRLEQAVVSVLERGVLPRDLGGTAGTAEIADAVIAAL
jgi:3-isopropylmalate dehydrogenase